MEPHEDVLLPGIQVEYEIVDRSLVEQELTEKLKRVERAIAFRRLTKEARKDRPITFVPPTLWSISRRANER